MTVDIRILNRTAGGDGSPGGTGNAGNLALNFDPAAKGVNGGLPKLFASDGTVWVLMNPPATAPSVGSISLPGAATPGSPTGIGNAWTAFATKPTDPIVIAKYGGTAYVKTGAGAADTDWAPLGSATNFATAAEILTGTEASKAIAPDQLRAYALAGPTGAAGPVAGDANHMVLLDAVGQVTQAFIPNADATETLAGALDTKFITPADLQSRTKDVPGGAGGTAQGADAGYLVRLDANGQINAGFLSIKGLTYRGNLDLTGAYPTLAGLKVGDFGTVQTKGTAVASWPGFTGGEAVEVGDLVIFDGTIWHLVEHGIDTTAYVSKSGANAIQNDMTMTWAAPTALITIIDGGNAATAEIKNVTIGGGQF